MGLKRILFHARCDVEMEKKREKGVRAMGRTRGGGVGGRGAKTNK